MIKHSFILFAAALFLITSCKPAITVKALTGKWKYIKVENPNSSPPDSVKKADLDAASPYIQFTPELKFVIVWGGKFLSHGSYTLDGSNMNVKEVLPDGKTRDFAFYISELTDDEIIFESTGKDGSKVTALKVKSLLVSSE
ncbi:hypothetical protein [Mucilaginibacter sp. SP1R1]|uniref:hypothetical protein n=1 Tax=Mucilaginibacter sp. SP1R1 TaxID=2723091 RepID=UPI00161EDAEF|nr:hypothetical protein [Mucilaginibacter sp. SP1R1]MBB6147849.1 hypothetical protein [Mucilaginibacter sp. SP1R1]